MDMTEFDTVQACNDGATMEVRNPATGEIVEGMTIRVAGKDSDVFTKASRAVQDKRMVLSRGKLAKPKSAEYEADALDILSRCVMGWTGIELKNESGKMEAVEFSRASALMLLTKYPWLKEQVDEFIGERAYFLGNKSNS